jgi:transmembrane 9 superfamily protein 2/4
MVAMILVGNIYRDISRYNAFNDEDEAHEKFGWKMVHADVFRPPNHRMILCVLLGTGSQVLGMVCVTLCILFFDYSLCTLGLFISV